MIKTVSSINNDNSSKEVANLFITENTRKNNMNESVYFSNFVQLSVKNSLNPVFRALYSPDTCALTLHYIDLPLEINKRESIFNYKQLLEVRDYFYIRQPYRNPIRRLRMKLMMKMKLSIYF